uniref:Uncharacterized protein n=1 Tax=Cannabis sativa TaxID=3483 RepID=A0A803NNN0_CANSA
MISNNQCSFDDQVLNNGNFVVYSDVAYKGLVATDLTCAFVEAMLITIDVSDLLEAETWALLHAQLCRLHGWISLTLASYFQQLVHGILAHKALDWRSATVFEALNELMVGLINFIVVWFSQLSVFNIIGS